MAFGGNGAPILASANGEPVREDYSPNGNAWQHLPHDYARSRAYRWGEDGIADLPTITRGSAWRSRFRMVTIPYLRSSFIEYARVKTSWENYPRTRNSASEQLSQPRATAGNALVDFGQWSFDFVFDECKY